MSSMLRNVAGNETEPTILVYQSKKGMKEIRKHCEKMTKEGGIFFLHLMANVAQGY
jgi:hypothetical protein